MSKTENNMISFILQNNKIFMFIQWDVSQSNHNVHAESSRPHHHTKYITLNAK